MARGHGRILTSIWEDEDFKDLDEQQQRMYLFLISQPNLNHAGLLDLTLRRWSRKARGLTVAELEKRIAALEETRFVVVDDDTEELLIRSFVRNDGVWRMPKVMGAMVSGALEISSRRLQRALLAEMDRIPLGELNDEPAKLRNGTEGPSIRQQVAAHIDTLRRAFHDPNPDPTERGSVTPSDTPSVAPSDTPDEGGPKGSTRGRAATHVHAAPAPAPTPTPAPEEEGRGGGAVEPARSTAEPHPMPDGLAPIDVDGFTVTDAMRRWVGATYPNLNPNYETEQFISHFRAEGTRRRNWPEEWKKWIRRADKWDTERRSGSNVRQLPASRPSTTDARVAQGLALAAKYREQEQRALEASSNPPQESA
ncbi:hypothetical protein [Streptomyces nigrescens]